MTQIYEVMLEAPTDDLKVMHDAVYRTLLKPAEARDFSFAPVASGVVVVRGGAVAGAKGSVIRTPARGKSVGFMLVAAPRHKQGRLLARNGDAAGAIGRNPLQKRRKRRTAYPTGEDGDTLRIDWLKRRASENGFEIDRCVVVADKVEVRGTGTIEQCEFYGMLRVVDEELFAKALLTGIGPARTYGFGMIRLLDQP